MTRSVFLDRELRRAEAGDVVEVTAAVAHHLRVSRITMGEEFDLVDGSGLRLRSVLAGPPAPEAVADDEDRSGSRGRRGRRGARRHVDEPLAVRVLDAATEAAGHPELVLVQALAKGDRDEQAVESATEMGVDRIIPWAAARSIAAWPSHKEEKQTSRWRSLLDSATQQSRRALAPELEPIARGNRVLERLQPSDHVLVLHEDAHDHLVDALEHIAAEHRVSRIVYVVGPEGGISPEELDAFRGTGARTVLLGPTVLRASSAGPAGIALAQAALGRWRSSRA